MLLIFSYNSVQDIGIMNVDDIWLTGQRFRLGAESLTGVLDWSQKATDNSQATGGGNC